MANVCYWHLADIEEPADECPLMTQSGLERVRNRCPALGGGLEIYRVPYFRGGRHRHARPGRTGHRLPPFRNAEFFSDHVRGVVAGLPVTAPPLWLLAPQR